MSALGHKQTFAAQKGISALPRKRTLVSATSATSLILGCSGSPSTSNKIIQIRTGFFAQTERYCAQLGSYIATSEMEQKRLSLLHELTPGVPLIGVLLNPNFADAALQLPALEQAARMIGRRILIAKASNDEELNAAFALLVQQGIGALQVATDPYFDTRLDRIIAFAAQNRLPAVYQFREYALAGGLVSYAPSITEVYRQAGNYTGRSSKVKSLPIFQFCSQLNSISSST